VNYLENLLTRIINENKKYTNLGNVADYIPELKKANKEDLGVYIYTTDNEEYFAGDYNKKFSIQSISKIVTLMLALIENGEEYVFEKVGVEPTADSFNSIVSLETKNFHKPLNPMINSGAIAVISMISENKDEEPIDRILKFIRKITDNQDININEKIYLSEKETGHRNRALSYFMKSTNILEKNVEEVLDTYFKACSIEVTCKDIAKIASVLANGGILPWSKEKIIPRKVTRIIKTIMVTCGMYDASGEFAVSVGVPSKSGVGGGILSSVPSRMGIGVYGPALDSKGNSIGGIKVLEELSERLDLSIF
jgi:glutaminase